MSPRIVVVDADLATLALMHDLLAPEGYRVACASTAAAGWCAIRQERPALIVLDLRLGTADACWRLVERLRADLGTADIPIVACSIDHRALHALPAWLRERQCTTLTKPFTREDLLRRVEAAIAVAVLPHTACLAASAFAPQAAHLCSLPVPT
jgi:two-component system sensor histidine kinase ChiS